MSDDNQNQSTTGDDQSSQSNSAFSMDDIKKVMNENFHKQTHISTLEQENKEFRDKISALETQVQEVQSMKEMLAELRDTNSNYEQSQSGPTAPQVNETELLAQLEQKVFNKLTEQQQQAHLEQNWTQSMDALREQHGDKFEDYVASRAQTLGMSNEQVSQMAATTPKAFLDLMSVPNKSSTAPTIPGTRAPVSDPVSDQETEFDKVARLQKYIDTPEGREAREKWMDPIWQAQQRQRILEKAQDQGSQFGNRL